MPLSQMSDKDRAFFYPKRGKDVSIACKRVLTYQNGQYINGHHDARVNSYTLAWTNYRTTSKSPSNWKELKARGIDVTTNLDAFRRTLDIQPSAYFRDSYGGNPAEYKYCFGSGAILALGVPASGHTTFDPTLLQKASDQARINFTKSYRKAKSTWMSGQFIGELAETVRFLKSPLKSLDDVTRDLLKRTVKTKRKFIPDSRGRLESAYLRAATDSWLAYQYAAKPLVSDINGGIGAYNKALSDQGEGSMIRIYGSSEQSTDWVRQISLAAYPVNDLGLGGSTTCRVLKRSRTTVSVVMRGAFRLDAGPASVLDSFGLTPDQWVPTVYELIPFSFVADYFSNLGDVIDTISFEHLVYLAWQNRTFRQTVEYELNQGTGDDYFGPDIWGAPLSSGIYTSFGGRVLDKHVLVSRKPGGFPDFSTPSVRLKLPNLKQALNVTALLNSLTSTARMP
jgi:hypothetical protein